MQSVMLHRTKEKHLQNVMLILVLPDGASSLREMKQTVVNTNFEWGKHVGESKTMKQE